MLPGKRELIDFKGEIMMGRIGVSYEEIECQAEMLVAKGQNPTLEKIRRALGDRGSNSTLSKYINEWRGRRSKATSSISIPNPINLSDPVNEAVNRIWQKLKEEAEFEIAKIKEEAQEAVETANLSVEELMLERNQALEEVESLKTNVKNFEKHHLNLEKDLIQTQKELAIKVGRLEELTHRHEEFKHEKETQFQAWNQSQEQTIHDLKEQNNSLKNWIDIYNQEKNDLLESLRRERAMFTWLEENIKS